MLELDPSLLPGALAVTDRLAVSPNGLMLAAITRSDTLLIWDVPQRTVLARHARQSSREALAWASDDTLILGRWDGYDEVHALTGERLAQWDCDGFGFVTTLLSMSDGTTVAGGSEKIAFLRGGEVVREHGPWLDEHGWPEQPRHIDLHPDGTTLAVSFSQWSRIIDRDGEDLALFDDAQVLRFGAGGDSLLEIAWNGATLYDWPELSSARPINVDIDDALLTEGRWLGWTHESVTLLESDGTPAWSTRFYDGVHAVAAHGSRFYTASRMQWLGVRDIDSAELVTILPAGAGQHVNAIAFDDTGELLIVADDAGRVTIWDFHTATAQRVIDTSSLQGSDAAMEVAALSSAEQIWVRDGELNIAGHGRWHTWPALTSNDLNATAPTERDSFSSFSKDGRLAISIHDDVRLLVRTERDEQVAILPPHEGFREDLQIHGSGRWILFNDATGDGTTLRLWSIEQQTFECELYVDQPAEFVAFDGDAVVGWVSTDMVFDWDTAGEDVDTAPNVFFRWEPETGDVVRWLNEPQLADYYDIQFAADLTLFTEGGPAMLLESGEFELLTQHSTGGAMHQASGRIAIAMEHGVIALIDRGAGTEVLICATADGSVWSLRDGELDHIRSEWAES